MKHTLFAFLIQMLMASIIIYVLPGELDKKTILVFICELPIWLLFTFWKMPKTSEIWKKKLLFAVGLGFGLSVFFFILSLLVMAFAIAITGSDAQSVYLFLFIPFHGVTLALAGSYHQKEIKRLWEWGLDYRENLGDPSDEGSDAILTQGMGETLRMLTILSLEPDLNMQELKERYRELSKLYHPDRLAGMGESEKLIAETEFKRIKRAYELVKSQLEKGEL